MITLNLEKGSVLNLTKTSPVTTKYRVGMGWNPQQVNGSPAFDLDASVLLLQSDKKIKSNSDVIYFGNKKSLDGSVIHHGDNLTGEGDGDDEVIDLDMKKLPSEVKYVLFVVNIYQASQRNQTFGQVDDSYIAIYDQDTGDKICQYSLKNEFVYDQGVIFGVLEKQADDSWVFTSVGSGFQGDLGSVLKKYS